MKKLLIGVLILILALSAAACGTMNETQTSEEMPSNTQAENNSSAAVDENVKVEPEDNEMVETNASFNF
ncbi:MAG: hypothetical protein ACI4D3_13940, partial [Lachnospiraceae bacterium]